MSGRDIGSAGDSLKACSKFEGRLQPFPRRRIWLMDSPRFLSGKLLLAMPGIGDPRFEQAVIAMCVHDENGAVGIGIGHQRAGIGVRGLLEQLGLDPGKAPDGPVMHGGPVEPGRGFVLHSDDWGGQDTIQVVGLGALTGTIDVLKAIADGKGRAAIWSHLAMPAGAKASSTKK